MSDTPMLSFLATEAYGQSMVLNEVDMHASGVPLAPFKASRFVVYPGNSSPLDLHDVKECWFIASGEGEVTYNGKIKVLVKPGDVLYYDSQKSHEIHNKGPQDLVVFSVWWK